MQYNPMHHQDTNTNPVNPSFEEQVASISEDWEHNKRWRGLRRDYSAADVVRLRGSVTLELTLARQGSAKLW
ncbi:MAG: hypothetical protein OXB90_02665, partial [Acidimicrobiaceae bacterium]|nr:hypothetical protein [Acidimicrobiaceae bacterium]